MGGRQRALAADDDDDVKIIESARADASNSTRGRASRGSTLNGSSSRGTLSAAAE